MRSQADLTPPANVNTTSSGDRGRTTVNCSKCGAQATVPFTPTPGRPVYCRSCFERRPAPGPRRGGGGPARAKNTQPQRRMLSMRRKGHFVHDALQVLDGHDAMDENQRRAFVEMLFTRGARQTSTAAIDFLEEKQAENLLPEDTAQALVDLVERYSKRQ